LHDKPQRLSSAIDFAVHCTIEDYYPPLQRWFGRDITERKQADAALAAKERQLRHVSDSATIMVSQCSRDLRYVFVNKTCAEFFGRPIDRIVGLPIVDVIGSAAFETILPYVERVLSGERVEYETEIAYPQTGRRTVRAVYVPDYEADGSVCGWIATLTDVTERRQLENDRDALLSSERAARQEFERVARVKDEFLAMDRMNYGPRCQRSSPGVQSLRSPRPIRELYGRHCKR
jgi:PAS domain S-box-containing protein